MKKITCLNILNKIYLIRYVEKRIVEEYKYQRIRCPVHLSIGQEGVSAALSQIYKKNDYAISYHRSHAHYLSKNGDLKKMVAELYGKKNGCSKGIGGSMHLIDKKKKFIGSTAIVGGSIPVGVGFAESLKIKKQKGRIFIFIGDASVEEGVFFESLNYCVLKKLPVVFICENNNYSVYSPIKNRQPKNRKISVLVKSFGINSFHLKELDPFKLYLKMQRIIRRYKSPIFIEIKTFRLLEHCGVNNDDHLKYRSQQEINFYKNNDPMYLAEKNNLTSKYFSKKILNKLKKNNINKVNQAFLDAIRSKSPRIKEIFNYD